MKYFSMFSGIGGFEYGINDKGTCIGFSEIDNYAKSIYKKHFPNHTDWGDATKIKTKTLPKFDLLVGGFPCQAFSVAGKRKGFKDTRGTLFFEIARVLKDKRPRHFLLENVAGLLSHDDGKTFQTILRVLTDLGYNIEWALLNSKDFGVPQNRERVFIVGHFGGKCGRKILPVRGTDGKTLDYIGAVMSKSNQKWVEDGKELSRNFPQGQRVYSTYGISSTLCGNAGGLGGKTGLYAIPTTKEGNAHAIDANYWKGCYDFKKGLRTQVAIPVLTPDRLNKRQNGRRFKTDGEPAFTCTAQDRHGVYNGMKIRRLTPVECERLQGFPDNYTKHGQNGELISDSQRYKCLGNAVTTTVITAIMEKFYYHTVLLKGVY
jgi:DNA (cytosine-5)-methyltransferase 1